jgi:hypothetical protein
MTGLLNIEATFFYPSCVLSVGVYIECNIANREKDAKIPVLLTKTGDMLHFSGQYGPVRARKWVVL